MSVTLIGAKQFCRVLGIGDKVLESWVSQGIIKPCKTANGPGTRRGYSVLDLLSVCLARRLRMRGFGLPACKIVAGWLMNQTLDNLKEQWARDRVLLFVAGDRVFNRLLKQVEIYGASPVNILKEHTADQPIAIIDIRKAYALLMDELERDGQRHHEKPTGDLSSRELAPA
jgi:DNA-binding transcriptional MerR regulator